MREDGRLADWRGLHEIFQIPDERGIPEQSVTTQKKMDSEGEREPEYEDLKAYLME